MIVVERNPQMNFEFQQTDGSNSGEVSLKLSEVGYGEFKRVAQGDGASRFRLMSPSFQLSKWRLLQAEVGEYSPVIRRQ